MSQQPRPEMEDGAREMAKSRVKPFDGPAADEATGPLPPGVDEPVDQPPDEGRG
jgi:hypothetical protein